VALPVAALVDEARGARLAPAARRELERSAQAWSALSSDACEATRVRGDQSQRLYERQQDCLDERLAQLRAVVTLLERAPPRSAAVERAAAALQSLGALADCADAQALLAPTAPPSPGARAAARSLRSRLALPQAQLLLGD